MWKRIVTGVALAGIVLMAILWWRQASEYFVDALVMVFTLVAVFEVFKSFKAAEYNPMLIPVALCSAMIYPMTYFLSEIGIAITVFVGIIVGLINFTFSKKFELKDLFATSLILVYPLGLLSLLVVMNQTVGELLALLLIIAIAALTDTMALFTGITFKGKKLCPEISPKKTVSGAIGGIVGGMLGATLIFLLFDYFRVFDGFKNVGTAFAFDGNLAKSLPFYLVTGLIGAVMCEIGDLVASRIKRSAGIKDFGRIFPGHGGVMDRLDGIIFVIPIVYFAIKTIPYLT